jgi:FKBP-type peptidyl-prolyl cis-trans isomerase 2
MDQVTAGDVVQIHYTGRLDDGTVFDSSSGGDPLEFTAGSNELIDGVSRAVLGMQEGEKKSLTIEPEDGYGQRQPGLEQRVPRSSLPEGVSVGDRLSATAGGQTIPVWITEISDEAAVVDANHPLAGKTLTFDIELVSVQQQGNA